MEGERRAARERASFDGTPLADAASHAPERRRVAGGEEPPQTSTPISLAIARHDCFLSAALGWLAGCTTLRCVARCFECSPLCTL